MNEKINQKKNVMFECCVGLHVGNVRWGARG